MTRPRALTARGVALSILLVLASCTDPDGSRDVLEAAGYSEVRIVERPHWWTSNCGERDTYATPFTAEGPTGIPVEGVVCSQGRYGKGATIRITRVNRPARATGLPLMPGSAVR
ncbi:hypothetical protein MKK70_21420 [Methylobacterium sp. E-041]|uniref:hypothetical protein n=1 Tax=Methylobacterium sp. E-041 TaxID=2836573 RepID=UPI001FB9E340|nr:hypothetical protein [Methylobacterium sp. E-041]MCJ2107889.1 hypothetical protein [Methylobacterium sp. E-041]